MAFNSSGTLDKQGILYVWPNTEIHNEIQMEGTRNSSAGMFNV